MFDGILTPEFLQAACAHQQSQNVIRLHVSDKLDYAPNFDLSYSGLVTITYVSDGETYTTTVDEVPFTIVGEPDADTFITIKGDVSRLSLSAPSNGAIDAIYTAGTKALLSLTTNSGCKELQLSKYLTYLKVNGTAVTKITYPANNNAVSTAIANAITNASANNGTVYTDPNGTYYDTIAQAATAKGWTIQQL